MTDTGTAEPTRDLRVQADLPSPLLDISGLTVAYDRRRLVLADVALGVAPGEIVGIVGETGSGKTTLARAVVGLVPASCGRIAFEGTDLTGLRGRALREFRRTGRLQFVFQDPLRALDPDLDVRTIIAEPLAVSGTVPKTEHAARVARALEDVGLDAALAERRPAQLSGGQRQRVLLARALVTEPALLIADEPVSALDAATRNHVLALLAGLRARTGTAVLVITHDLASLAGLADRVAVLRHGRIVEAGPVAQVLEHPTHPYTARLVAATPRLRRAAPAARAA